MRVIRSVLMGGAAVMLSAGMTFIGVSAASAGAHVRSPGLPNVKVIHLAAARAARVGHTRRGKIAGIVYPIGKKLHKQAASGCSEPDCNLLYNGGAVQHSPHVYLLFWGPAWSSNSGEAASASYLESFYEGLGAQPGDSWSTITDQYSDGTGHPSFGGSVYEGAFQDTSTPPTGVGQSQLAAEADAFTSSQGITDLADAQIVIATQSGTCPQGFYAPSCNGGSGSYCAWHSSSNEPYTNLPYILDAGTGCGEDFVNANGTHDGFSMVGGHEYAETITDPYPASGWWDPNDGVSGGEIGDKCAWGGELWGDSDPFGNVTLSTGSFAMQSLWSNSAGGCVMSAPGGDTVTVTSPGNRSNITGGKYDLAITGSSSGGYALTWTAVGLPSGMSINSSTGVISGKFSTTGTYSSKVTATDATGQSGSASFKWVVRADAGSAIKGYRSLCLDDYGAFELANNRVDIYTCNSTGAQKWSFYSGELHVFGLCLADTGGSGTSIYITHCRGASTEVWTHRTNGEYVLKSNGLCLTDPGNSVTPGTTQQLAACKDTASQKWSGS